MSLKEPQRTIIGARIYALDNLRGILMWLGIVVHVTVIYAYESPPCSFGTMSSARSWLIC